MTPEQEAKLNEIYEFMQNLKNTTTIPLEVDAAFRDRLASNIQLPQGLENAPLAAISAPSGGATQDSEARSAINTIRSRLTSLGLTL